MSARTVSLALALALLLGCADDPKRALPRAASATPLTLEDGLFYLVGEPNEPASDAAASAAGDGARALSLDFAADPPRVIERALPAGPLWSFARPGRAGREVVVLTGGREADERRSAVSSQLVLIDRQGERAYPLHGRFEQLTLSDDGRFALAFAPRGNRVLQNAVEIVDLDQVEAGLAPSGSSPLNLELDGRAPTRFVFSPRESFMRRVVVVPFPNAVQLIDLEHPERGAISIPLSASGETLTLEPQEILFADDRIFVQRAGSSQILSIQLIDAPQSERGFQPAPSLLSASAGVSDVALSPAGEPLRLLALAGRLEILDPELGVSAHVEDARGFSQLLPFRGASPLDRQVASRALLYGVGQSQVGFVDLESAGSARPVERVELGAPLVRMLPLASRNLALALHMGERLSVIDLEQRTVAPIVIESPIAALLLDERERPRLWLGSDDGSFGVLDLESFVDLELPISYRAARSLDLAGASLGNLLLVPGMTPRVAVLNASELGSVTLLHADDPRRETALELEGFFLAGLFD